MSKPIYTYTLIHLLKYPILNNKLQTCGNEKGAPF